MLPPCGPFRIEDAHRVDDDQRGRMNVARSAIDDVDALVQAVSPPAEDAVPVLHRRRELGEVVVLGDRDVDDLVGVDQRREDRPLVEHIALEAHRAETVLLGQDDLLDQAPVRSNTN